MDGSFTSVDTHPGGGALDDVLLSLAYERAGTYTVTVTKPGYREWRRTGVQVGRDECHVITVPLTARLQQ
ncbi:MAG: PEGA domain-containing protein [Gemmatimonadaceae bacterium]